MAGYIVGLTDGEGCFEIPVNKRPNSKFGYQIRPEFRLTVCDKGFSALEDIRKFFGFGNIYVNPVPKGGIPQVQYVVGAIDDLKKILDFFKKHPLKVKREQFEIWARAVEVDEKRRNAEDDKEEREKFLKLALIRENLFNITRKTAKKRKYTYGMIEKEVNSRIG